VKQRRNSEAPLLGIGIPGIEEAARVNYYSIDGAHEQQRQAHVQSSEARRGAASDSEEGIRSEGEK
jgi:hypothetical protein